MAQDFLADQSLRAFIENMGERSTTDSGKEKVYDEAKLLGLSQGRADVSHRHTALPFLPAALTRPLFTHTHTHTHTRRVSYIR